MAATLERTKIDTRWTQLDGEFSSWRSHYEDLSKYLLPRNGRFFSSDRNKGNKRHGSIYDNTGTRALNTVVSGLMAGASSPARPWVRVLTSNPQANRNHENRAWLDEVTRIILRVCAKSNVYRALPQMYAELAAFGTAACIVLPDFENVIHCYLLTAGEYRLAQDYRGKVNTCYRRFEKTVAEVVAEFGFDNCSDPVKTAFKNGSLGNAVTIIHMIEPRKDRDPSKRDNLNMPWRSCYYEEGQEQSKTLRESGFEYFPVLAPRWSVAGGDVYGHGPGMDALGDVKQLQHQQFRKAQAIDFKVNPPLQAPTSLKSNPNSLLPGGISYVDATSASQAVRSLFEVNLDLQHLLADLLDVRERINGAFFADLFRMLSLAGTNTRMTATEVAERHEEKLIQLGPVLENLHTEMLEPLVRLIYEACLAAGILPEAPAEIADMDLTLEFISMLAQAQRAVGVAGIERTLGIALSIAEAKPEVLDNIDADAVWLEVNEMIGITPRITVEPRKRDQLRDARAQAQAAAAQAEAAATQAKTTRDLAAAPTTGRNALTDVLSMFSGMNHPPALAV